MIQIIKYGNTLIYLNRGVLRVKLANRKVKPINEVLDGLNSVIQATKSKTRGYKTFKNYKIIIYLLTEKLDFSLINHRFKILDF